MTCGLGLPRSNTSRNGPACSRFALRAPGAPKRRLAPDVGAQRLRLAGLCGNCFAWCAFAASVALVRTRFLPAPKNAVLGLRPERRTGWAVG